MGQPKLSENGLVCVGDGVDGETAMFHAMPKIRSATATAIVHETAHSRPTTRSNATAAFPTIARAASQRSDRSVARRATIPYLAASRRMKPAITTRRTGTGEEGRVDEEHRNHHADDRPSRRLTPRRCRRTANPVKDFERGCNRQQEADPRCGRLRLAEWGQQREHCEEGSGTGQSNNARAPAQELKGGIANHQCREQGRTDANTVCRRRRLIQPPS